MNQPCLKLTTYFGERERAVSDARRPGFLADALLDLFDTREVATSVMLRGAASFGPRHVLRTDESLTLSEDPPVAIAAVDEEPKIRGLLDDVVRSTRQGLVTLERARLVTGDDVIAETDAGDAVKLTVYVGRQERIGRSPAYRAVCDLLYRRGFSGGSVFLGVDGTTHGRRQRAHFFSRNVNVPMMIMSIGTAAQVSAAVAEIGALLPTPLLTVERVRICKRGGALLAAPHRLPVSDDHARPLWQQLTVYTSEPTDHGGQSVHRALIRNLLDSGLARGATVLRGIWGFSSDREPHGDRLFQLTRRVPSVTVLVDTPERIARTFDVVDEVTAGHGLVTSEMVPAVVTISGDYRDGDGSLARHDY